MRPSLNDLQSASLRTPTEPTVVRDLSFFVKDMTPDPKPAWIIPNRLAVGSQDCAFSDETKHTFTHCVNVGYDIPNAFEKDGLIYKQISIADLETFEIIPLFEELHHFIDAAIGLPEDINNNGGEQPREKKRAVLIHCQAGVSRSVTVALSYMMLVRARRGEDPSLEACLRELKVVRPSASPNLGFMSQLQKWELVLRERYSFHFDDDSSVRERNLRIIRNDNSAANLGQRSFSTKPPFKVRIRRMFGALRFLYFLLRPSATMLSWVLTFVATYMDRRASRRVWILWLLTLAISADLSKDEVFRANLLGRLNKGARPGVFFAETSSKMKQLVTKLPTVQRGYRLPPFLRWLGGDIATVSFLLFGYRPRTVRYRREHLTMFDEELQLDRKFTLDWSFPQGAQKTASCCCLLLAGIGGNSESPYVRDVVTKLNDDGMVVAVLLARGLGICSSTSTLDRIYNPTDDGDVHVAVTRLAKMYHKVTVVGFSLGGVTTCRYFSVSAEDKIPPNVVGGVGVSGAFKVGFIDLPRYQNVYQEVLVPGLIDDICLKYGEELQQRIGSVDNLWQSTTYRDIHRELFTNARIPNVETDYDKWREKLEACASRVHRPLLVLTALDDPLHHPEYLGLNKLWGDPGAKDEPNTSDNLLVVVTDSGGHVAWPEESFHLKGYHYMQRVVSEFCRAAIEGSEHPFEHAAK